MLLDNVNRKIRTGFISLNLRFKIYVDFAFIEVFCELYFIKYEIFCREVRKKNSINRQSFEGDDFDFICFIAVVIDIITVIDTQKVEAR